MLNPIMQTEKITTSLSMALSVTVQVCVFIVSSLPSMNTYLPFGFKLVKYT